MTKYVCYHHDTDDDMIPSPHLNVEVSANQRKALNPTVCDIQIGAVIAQIFGDKAKTKIAKRQCPRRVTDPPPIALFCLVPEQSDWQLPFLPPKEQIVTSYW